MRDTSASDAFTLLICGGTGAGRGGKRSTVGPGEGTGLFNVGGGRPGGGGAAAGVGIGLLGGAGAAVAEGGGRLGGGGAGDKRAGGGGGVGAPLGVGSRFGIEGGLPNDGGFAVVTMLNLRYDRTTRAVRT